MSTARIASVIVALASVTAAPARTEASCMSGAVSVWPENGATVPPNVRFVVELYGSERDRADYLDRGGAALVSSGLRIPLSPVWRSEGRFGITQVVLVPVFPLRPGHRYTLMVPESETGREQTEIGTWTVGTERDTMSPTWRAPPEPLGYQLTRYGCGPARRVVVGVDLPELDAAGNGADAVRIRAELRAVGDGGEAIAGYVSVRRGVAAIGHGMCSGMWKLPNDTAYRLTLVAVDAAGNEARMPGPSLRVAHPGQHTLGPDTEVKLGLARTSRPRPPPRESGEPREGISLEPAPLLDPLSLGRLVPALLMVLAIGGMLFAHSRRRG